VKGFRGVRSMVLGNLEESQIMRNPSNIVQIAIDQFNFKPAALTASE
jgi:hypothetical protein